MLWFELAILSALCSAASAVMQKKILFSLHALEFSFLVSLVIGIVSAFAPLSSDPGSIGGTVFAVLLLKSVISGLAFFLVMIALEANPISTALPILGITPAVAAFLSLLMLGEELKGLEMAGVILMLAGCTILDYRPGHSLRAMLAAAWTSRSHYPVFGAVLLFGVSSVLDRKLVAGLHVAPMLVLFYQHLVYVLMFGLFLLLQHSSLLRVLNRGWRVLPLILLVAVLTLAYRLLQLEATVLVAVPLVLAVKRTSILFASLVGGKLFREERLGIKMAGATMIVAAGFLILRNVG